MSESEIKKSDGKSIQEEKDSVDKSNSENKKPEKKTPEEIVEEINAAFQHDSLDQKEKDSVQMFLNDGDVIQRIIEARGLKADLLISDLVCKDKDDFRPLVQLVMAGKRND
jgi:hypothetical protein